MSKCIYCGQFHNGKYLCPAKLNAGITTQKLNTQLHNGVIMTLDNLKELFNYAEDNLNRPLECLTEKQFNKIIVEIFKEV